MSVSVSPFIAAARPRAVRETRCRTGQRYFGVPLILIPSSTIVLLSRLTHA